MAGGEGLPFKLWRAEGVSDVDLLRPGSDDILRISSTSQTPKSHVTIFTGGSVLHKSPFFSSEIGLFPFLE